MIPISSRSLEPILGRTRKSKYIVLDQRVGKKLADNRIKPIFPTIIITEVHRFPLY
jgi:hypothetical protein